ncbi:hypothetical protein D3C81_1712690 [compost metagenome]
MQPLQQRRQRGDVVIGAAHGRQRRRGALQVDAQVIQVRQAGGVDIRLARQLEPRRAGTRAHRAANALARLDKALRAQMFRDFADHRGADAVLLRELLAGRQPGADRIRAAFDIGAQLAGDLFGEGDGTGSHSGRL